MSYFYFSLFPCTESVLMVDNLLLVEELDAANAVGALAHALSNPYLQVRIDHPSVAASLRQAAYPPDQPNWSTFMIKPLIPGVTAQDARTLFGVGTERFLISRIDVT